MGININIITERGKMGKTVGKYGENSGEIWGKQ